MVSYQLVSCNNQTKKCTKNIYEKYFVDAPGTRYNATFKNETDYG